jgi:CRISPR-associated protein Cmr2
MTTGGITIGPILETLSTAKKERELWFGSYLFSWLMEHLCYALTTAGCEMILPAYGINLSQNNPVGLYPDRLYFTSVNAPDKVINTIDTAYDSFLNMLTNIYGNAFYKLNIDNSKKLDATDAKSIIKDYLQVKWFVKDGDGVSIEQALFWLETAELSCLAEKLESAEPCDRCRTLPSTLVVEDPNDKNYGKQLYLCPVCAIKYGAHLSVDVQDKTGIKPGMMFPSVIDIGAREITEKDAYKKLKDDDAKLKLAADINNYLTYFAVLCLDMDNAGKLLKNIQKDKNQVKVFSQALFAFSRKVSDCIKAYGGETIYAGGDDVLALIPIRNEESKLKEGDTGVDNFLDLVNKINTCFDTDFPPTYKNTTDKDRQAIKLSLSFGISIQYVKYPLKDALQSAYDSLFAKAKQTRNTLSMIIRKHAGATFEISLGLDKITQYRDMFNKQIQKAFLQEGLYDSLAKIAPEIAISGADSLEAIFMNQFNEKHHTDRPAEFQTLREILAADLGAAKSLPGKEQTVLNLVNLFRLAKLMEAKK